jgi:hypothetical protein
MFKEGRFRAEPVYVYSLKEGINDGFLTPLRSEADFNDALVRQILVALWGTFAIPFATNQAS